MLSLAKFGQNTGTRTLALKATQSTVEGFALLQFYFCHFLYPSPRGSKPKYHCLLYTFFPAVSIAFAIFVWKILHLAKMCPAAFKEATPHCERGWRERIEQGKAQRRKQGDGVVDLRRAAFKEATPHCDDYLTTRLTILPGTTISFTIVLPSRAATTRSSALASERASSLETPVGIMTTPRSLPLI